MKTSLLLFVWILTLTLVVPHSLQAADPAEAKTVGRIISQRAELSSFLRVLEKAELGSSLAEKTNLSYTVFAPSNKAFEALPEGAVATLLSGNGVRASGTDVVRPD